MSTICFGINPEFKTLNEEQINDNRREVARHIRSEWDQYDQGDYADQNLEKVYKKNIELDLSKPLIGQCGTPACVAGFASLVGAAKGIVQILKIQTLDSGNLKPTEKQIPFIDSSNFERYGYYSSYSTRELGEHILGLCLYTQMFDSTFSTLSDREYDRLYKSQKTTQSEKQQIVRLNAYRVARILDDMAAGKTFSQALKSCRRKFDEETEHFLKTPVEMEIPKDVCPAS